MRVTDTPNTTIKSLRVSLHRSIWNKVSLMYYHDFANLTIFLFIKEIMNLSLVVVSQIVYHTLYCLKYYKSLVICKDGTNRPNVNLKTHYQGTENGAGHNIHDKTEQNTTKNEEKNEFFKICSVFVWLFFYSPKHSVDDNF